MTRIHVLADRGRRRPGTTDVQYVAFEFTLPTSQFPSRIPSEESHVHGPPPNNPRVRNTCGPHPGASRDPAQPLIPMFFTQSWGPAVQQRNRPTPSLDLAPFYRHRRPRAAHSVRDRASSSQRRRIYPSPSRPAPLCGAAPTCARTSGPRAASSVGTWNLEHGGGLSDGQPSGPASYQARITPLGLLRPLTWTWPLPLSYFERPNLS